MSTHHEIQHGFFTRDAILAISLAMARPDFLAYTSNNIGLAVVSQRAASPAPNHDFQRPLTRRHFFMGSLIVSTLSELAPGDVNGDGRQDFVVTEMDRDTWQPSWRSSSLQMVASPFSPSLCSATTFIL